MSDKKNETKGENDDDRRRHTRINIREEMNKAKALKGASLQIEGLESSLQVIGMSVSGLACELADGVKEGAIRKAKIVLGELEPQELELKVIWLSSEMMGVRFEDCEASVKLSIGDFLQDRIVGQHMISVDPSYFAEHVDFHAWYHGPNNTNVFLWKKHESDDNFIKMMVAFDGQSLIFENGEFRAGGDQINWQDRAIYPPEQLPARSEKEEDLPVLLENDSALVRRALEVLSQVTFDKQSIQKLIREMEAV
ncbi:MAG: hypothetical protein HRT45_10430 [Bdellovibrionales bacterium]|nr:hypothetical protein [Bdellovibrionales bacterium]